MEADKILDAALKALGVPVARAFWKVTEKKPAPRTYFTYQLILAAGTLHADDDNEATESTWAIDLYSKDDYTALVKAAVQALKAADFYGVTVEAEQYERDTEYYHISFEAKYLTMEA